MVNFVRNTNSDECKNSMGCKIENDRSGQKDQTTSVVKNIKVSNTIISNNVMILVILLIKNLIIKIIKKMVKILNMM